MPNRVATQDEQREASSPTVVEVVCEGSPHEMGYSQGIGLREKIETACHTLVELEAFRLKQPWWMPYPLYHKLAQRRARTFLQGALSDSFSHASQRLAGIAEGSAFGLDTLYLLNALEPVLSSVQDCTVTPPLGACSAVAVRGARSATGEPIIARNFDYLPIIQPMYTFRESRPADGLRSLDFTVAPLCGSVDGMNEKGLTIAYNYAYAKDEGRPAAPISMIISETLQRCKTVTEAAEWITYRPRWGAGLLMLADETGDIAALELSNTRAELRRPAAGEDILCHSNRFTTETVSAVEIAGDAVYTNRAPTPLRGRRVHQSAEQRDRRFSELLDQTQRYGPDEFAELMADHGPNGQGSADTICMHSDYWNTTACLQYYPRSRCIRVAYDSACSARYAEIEL